MIGSGMMKEVFEKIKDKLEKLKEYEVNGDCPKDGMCSENPCKCTSCYSRTAIEIVDQVAKEFADDINVGRKNGWIPIEESLPDTDRLVLISFANYGVPQIGRYREDEEGGAFYLGDEDVPMSKYGIMVNAWMELPRCYEDK